MGTVNKIFNLTSSEKPILYNTNANLTGKYDLLAVPRKEFDANKTNLTQHTEFLWLIFGSEEKCEQFKQNLDLYVNVTL